MSRQFAGFSTTFDIEDFNQEGSFDGLVISSSDHMAAHYFTELGFETTDADSAPDIREVIPADGIVYATQEDLDSAATSAGYVIFMSEARQKEMFPNAEFKPGMRNFDMEPNELLVDDNVREALEKAGFDAFRGTVVVGIDCIHSSIYWKPGSFTLSGPVPLITEDDDYPSEVKIDFDALAAAPSIP